MSDLIVQEIRLGCRVCQAAEIPNHKNKLYLQYNPVMDWFLTNICVDTFEMPAMIWMGHVFEHLFIFVGRGSGWIIARHTT